MDEQEASFGESERFQQQHLFSSQSDIQVGEVIADEQRDLVRERWRVWPTLTSIVRNRPAQSGVRSPQMLR